MAADGAMEPIQAFSIWDAKQENTRNTEQTQRPTATQHKTQD